MAGKTCDICGKPSGMYPLCNDCFRLRDEGKVIKDENTGKWVLRKEEIELPTEGYTQCIICGKKTKGYAFCKLCYNKHTLEELNELLNNYIQKNSENAAENNIKKEIENKEINEEPNKVQKNRTIIIDNEHKNRCLTCGRETDGLLFCASCYKKYKNKGLLFKITNCSNVELLDESYEGIYACDDGHIVKSKSEILIDNYLFEKKIPHAYESGIKYGNGKDDIIKPDFYLPNYLGDGKDVYIEHWGYNENNRKYTESKNFKMPIYRERGITLINTYENSDMRDLKASLNWKLDKSNIKEKESNFEE